jgi:adenylate cyclase
MNKSSAGILFLLFFSSFSLLRAGPQKGLNSILNSNAPDSTKVRTSLAFFEKFYEPHDDSMAIGRPYLIRIYDLAMRSDYSDGIIDAAVSMAMSYILENNHAKALEYYYISLRYAELQGKSEKKAAAYMGIGLIYFTQHRWRDALEHFSNTIRLFKSQSSKVKQSTPIYLSGLCKIELRQFSSAIADLQQALSIAGSEKDSQRIHESYLGLGRAYARTGQKIKAVEFLDKAEKFYIQEEQFQALAILYLEKALLEYGNKNISAALLHANKAHTYHLQSSSQVLLIEIPKLLYELHLAAGNIKESLRYLKEYNDMRDSMFSRDILAEIAVTQAKHEFHKTENRIKEKLQENEIKKKRANLFLFLFGGFILFGSVAFYSVRKERRRSEKLLLNILPESTAMELKKFGHAIPKNHPAVSIMFCDVQAFTTISETLSPERLVSMLDYYFSGFDKIIAESGLEKIKTIGDSYMCVSGLNHNNPDHAKDAINAAIRLLEFVRESFIPINNRFGVVFQFRIGIHSGNVVSGIVGYNKYAYDIWGDAVNVAARMEQNSEPGRINISQDTLDLVQDSFKVVHRGKLPAKNKGHLDMYFIITPD